MTLADIVAWADDPTGDDEAKDALFAVDEEINSKVSLHRGDITKLQLDAIVNAANSTLLGGGGIDGAIHAAAGDGLYRECAKLRGCETGECKVTAGHRLPAKKVIHTVGPRGEREELLRRCYESVLAVVADPRQEIRSVALCGISTGIFGYPVHKAAHVALRTVRAWLDANARLVERIVFTVFTEEEARVYGALMPQYFPRNRREAEGSAGTGGGEAPGEVGGMRSRSAPEPALHELGGGEELQLRSQSSQD